MKTVSIAATLVVACLPAAAVGAEAYPAKAIRMVVPFPAGGTTDILARIAGQKLTEALKQQVIIDNRPGAGGNIGTELVAKWTADGGAVPAALAVGATRKRDNAPF